jgi:hypothetical protein
VAETSGLLNRRTGNSRTEGSNPSVSAIANVLSGWLPHCNRRYDAAWVGSSLVFGLLVQPLNGLLALMESASWVPIWNAGCAAFDIRWGVPAPV